MNRLNRTQDAINFVTKLIPRTSSLSIIQNACITQEFDKIEMISTNLGTYIKVTLPSLSEVKISSLVKSNILKNIKTLTLKETGSDIQLDNLTIPKNSVESFPALPENKDFELIGVYLTNEFIRKTNIASLFCWKDYPVKSISGIFLKDDTIVATSGHYLYQTKSKTKSKTDTLLPVTAIQLLNCNFVKQSESISLFSNKTHILIKGDSFELYAKKIEGNYPQYAELLKLYKMQIIKCKRAEMLKILESVKTFCNETTRVIKFRIDDGIVFFLDKGIIFSEVVDAIEQVPKVDSKIYTANVDYLIQCLKSLNNVDINIHIDLLDPLKPLLFSDTETLILLMLVRVAE